VRQSGRGRGWACHVVDEEIDGASVAVLRGSTKRRATLLVQLHTDRETISLHPTNHYMGSSP
jgi:hypothetical protein